MTRFGALLRAAHGFLFLFAAHAAGCSADGLKPRPDSGGDGMCGAIVCEAVPPSTAQCKDGRCLITLASGLSSPGDIVTDSTNVYWRNEEAGTPGTRSLMAVPLGGGTPVTLTSGRDIIQGIAVDATSVYWIKGSGDGSVMKAALNGANPTTLASGQVAPHYIAVDATNVYWTNDGWNQGRGGSAQADGAVMMVPLAGGPLTTLASWVYPWGIAVDSTSVYWTDGNTGDVTKVPVGGGAPTTLASWRLAQSIAVDSSSVYWSTGLRTLEKAPLNGGTPTTLATVTSPERPIGISVDATHVYWIATDGNVWNLMKVPLEGGTATTLASGPGTPGGLAVDATSIYWNIGFTTDRLGTVMKLTPK